MQEPIPVYGQGFFIVDPGSIAYIIVFDYYDPDRYYVGLARSGRVEDEERVLAENMQSLMDEERVIINGEDIRPQVLWAKVEIRGSPKRPSITFFTLMKYKPRPGANVYENIYDETSAEYDYTVYWIPGRCTRITSIDSPGYVEIQEHLAIVRVPQGTRIPGYESVSFTHTCI
ncbi:MAG: hypothetical protein F7C08_03310 [Desulfurococcales archaeon]|nr:hypothetical protein [Desulfurococcales archaeon]MCE4605541.1 hypothetical protein [Desulfurococcales archaeon]